MTTAPPVTPFRIETANLIDISSTKLSLLSISTKMPCLVTVLYPNEPDAKFDLDYYNKHHMPLVLEKFGPHGMKGMSIDRLPLSMLH